MKKLSNAEAELKKTRKIACNSICSANYLTGFYMTATLAFNSINDVSNSTQTQLDLTASFFKY